MMTEMISELAVWIILPILAKVLNSEHMVYLSEFGLTYILSGHSWSKALLAFLSIRICRWISEIVRTAVIPEINRYIRYKNACLYDED